MFRKIACFVLGSMISSAALNAADALREVASQSKPSVVKSALVGSVVGLGVHYGLQFYQNKNSSSKLSNNRHVDDQKLWNDVKALAHHPKDLWYTPESVWSDFKTLSADLKKWGKQNLNTVIIPVLSGIVAGTICHAVRKHFFWNALYEAAKEYVGSKTYDKHTLQSEEDFLCAALCKGAKEGNADLVDVLSKIKNYPIETLNLSPLITAFKQHWLTTGIQESLFSQKEKDSVKKCCESLIINRGSDFSLNSRSTSFQIAPNTMVEIVLNHIDKAQARRIFFGCIDAYPWRSLSYNNCLKIYKMICEAKSDFWNFLRFYGGRRWNRNGLSLLRFMANNIVKIPNGKEALKDVCRNLNETANEVAKKALWIVLRSRYLIWDQDNRLIVR